ncbi:50S ribosome-binding GTPase [Solirubrobacter taibaiensis]|nr:50S ribosome-binding GTPase [Solirubrobacter taibaiensis]
MTSFLDNPGGFATGRRRRAVSDMPRCTIVVVGKTGVGKSTLINGVFGEQLAETGVGRPVTQHFSEYSVPGMPVTIVDSRGIELSQDLRAVTDELLREIEDRLRGPADRHLHVLWYCISAEGARFEPETEGALLRAVGGSTDLPCLVVLTKAYDPEDQGVAELKRFVEHENLPLRGVVPVLAEGRYDLPPHGLDALITATEAHIDEGVRAAFVNAQVREIGAKLTSALARVDELADEQDTAYRPLAFASEAFGRGDAGEEERYLRRVLDVIAEVAAIFGVATATDERLEVLALATLGGQTGLKGLHNFLRNASRLALLIPPVGPTVTVKIGAKLVSALIAAEGANRVDKAERVRAQLLSRIYGRAAAAVLAEAAHADLAGRTLPDPDFAARFDEQLDHEAAAAVES